MPCSQACVCVCVCERTVRACLCASFSPWGKRGAAKGSRPRKKTRKKEASQATAEAEAECLRRRCRAVGWGGVLRQRGASTHSAPKGGKERSLFSAREKRRGGRRDEGSAAFLPPCTQGTGVPDQEEGTLAPCSQSPPPAVLDRGAQGEARLGVCKGVN